jgi:hypothetical protein
VIFYLKENWIIVNNSLGWMYEVGGQADSGALCLWSCLHFDMTPRYCAGDAPANAPASLERWSSFY